MTSAELEVKVTEILGRVVAGQPIEDSRVECKAEWPPSDLPRTARQLAAIANAAGLEPVLWIIGADEGNRAVPGADAKELADWYPQVQSKFDLESPVIQMNLVVGWESRVVMALLFETNRAPYVVRSSPEPAANREVPWREGTRTRSANRSELLRMLLPTERQPEVEVLAGRVTIELESGTTRKVSGQMKVYVSPRPGHPATIVHHRCAFEASFDRQHWFPIPIAAIKDDSLKTVSSHETRLSESKMIMVFGAGSLPETVMFPGKTDLTLRATLVYEDRTIAHQWSIPLSPRGI